MTGVHGNNICADVSSSLKISEDFFLTSKVSFHRAAIPLGSKREDSSMI